MDLSENIKKLYNKVDEQLHEEPYFNDTKEVIKLEPHINIFSEVISSISKVSNDYKLYNAWKCISNGMNEEKSINELYNYVSGNTDRAFYISDSFRKIILSSSNIASSVLAYIVGEIVKGHRDFTQGDVIMYDTLSHMTDFDIKNFVDIMDNYIGLEEIGPDYINIYDIPEEKSIDYILTLKLCANTRLIEFETIVLSEGHVTSGDFYKITTLSNTLKEYINKTKQILNYTNRQR